MIAQGKLKGLDIPDLGSNSLCLCDEMVHGISETILSAFADMDPSKPIFFVVNSPGGYIDELNKLSIVLGQISKFTDLRIIVKTAESAAAFLVIGLDVPKYILPKGHILFHKIFFESSASIDEMKRLEIYNFILMRKIASRLKLPYKIYRRNVIDGDWVLNNDTITRLKIAKPYKM